MSPEGPELHVQPAGLFVGGELPVVEALNDAIVVAAVDNRILYANTAVERLLGWCPDHLVGKLVTVLVPERFRASHLGSFARYFRTGQSRIMGQPTRVSALCADGSERAVELVLSTLPSTGGDELIVATIRDAIVRVDFERESALAHDLLRVFASDAAEAELIARILATLGESFEAAIAALWLPSVGRKHLHAAGLWHHDARHLATLEKLRTDLQLRFGENLVGRVWQSREAAWSEELAVDSNLARRAAPLADGLESAFAFPVRAKTATVGVIELLFAREAGQTPFHLVSAIGPQLGAFLQYKQVEADRERSAQRERLTVTALQKSLLPPDLPRIAGLDLGVHFRSSADDLVIGGDTYDIFALRDPQTGENASWGLLVGDVCGTGPEAAATTGLVRHTVRALAKMGLAPTDVLSRVNAALLDRGVQDDRFCTALFAVISETANGHLFRLANAGHPLPLLRRFRGRSEHVEIYGPLLGVLPTISPPEHTIELAPGDLILFYTDGITDARDGREQFGEDRLRSLLDDIDDLPAGEIAAAVARAVAAYARQLADDIVVLVAKVTDRRQR